MTRFIFTFIGLVFSLNLSAQSEHFEIDWGGTTERAVPGQRQATSQVMYSTAFFSAEENRYARSWVDDGYADPASLRVSNIRFEKVAVSQLSAMDRSLIPAELSYSIKSNRGRDEIFTTASLTPVIREGNTYKRVTSFDVSYSKSRRAAAQKIIPMSNSVLASGQWYKFRIEQTGVHRIDRDFLSGLGVDVNGLDPRRLKIYGDSGNMLPLLNGDNIYFDPPEVAIQVVGEGDGSFDAGDYILFYGEAQQYTDENNAPAHLNLYDDDTWYYITTSGDPGKRIQSYQEPAGAADVTFTEFHDYQFHEVDEVSPGMMGRRWFGERLDIQNDQEFSFHFPNLMSSQPVQLTVYALAASQSSTSLSVSVNGQQAASLDFGSISGSTVAIGKNFSGPVNISSDNIDVRLTYNNAGNPSSRAWLDFISIEALRALSGTGTQLRFCRNDAATQSGVGMYRIGNAAQFSQVWDVTYHNDVTALQTGGAGTFEFKALLGQARRYLAVNPDDYYTPVSDAQTTVPNQDLKGTIFRNAQGNFEDIDYLIITAPFLLQPALRLANFRKNHSGMNVKVVTTDKIYNEFSTGRQDIAAIRNFVKYIYDNASSPENRIRYVNLFGDSSVDYKGREPGSNNIVPTFHRYYQDVTQAVWMSDDFFVCMDTDEGYVSTGNDGDKLDISVGRMLADEVSLANAMVDKVIGYHAKESFGNWRNNFLIFSDDADDRGSDYSLQVSIDEMADEVFAYKPYINVHKIHADSYQQVSSAGGDRYPEVNQAIKDAMDVGALVATYFGHGGPNGVAHERIFTVSDIQSLKNRYLPLFVTMTCDLTPFDDHTHPSAGEHLYWNREGGAVAMITTTRNIFVNTGKDMNRELSAELYGYELGVPFPPSDALRRAKNQSSNSDIRSIFYIGDPAMELAFPKEDIRLTTLNDAPIGQATDTLKALSRVKLGGEVTDGNGNLLTGFNGTVSTRVFDKRQQRQTLGNDGTQVDNELFIMNFEVLGETIFNGQATVNNGKFDIEFIVPRDIEMPVDSGRVSFYAFREQPLEDYTGASEDILIGELDENAPEDNHGPQIQLFMNDESFVSGGITDDSPMLIAKLEDESGINTAGGIGHDITAVLDDDEANPFALNDYYQADVDNFAKGSLQYRLRDLEEGLHTLTLKAWDTYNNPATAEIQFVVVGSDKVKLENVLNYPNPFVNYTEFWFNHNQPDIPLEVQVQVLTVTGKVVWTHNQTVVNKGLAREIVWDGRDDFGDRIGKGVYVYKLTVKSPLNNKKAVKYEKLVIL